MGEHITHFQEAFEVISGLRAQLKISQCKHSRNKLELVGHIISSDGLAIDPERVIEIEDTGPA